MPGLVWRLVLAIAGVVLATSVFVACGLGYMNWLAVADQLEGLCWMLAVTTSLASVIFAVFRRRPGPQPEATASGVELAVAHAISLYASVSLARGRSLAPGFINHLRALGYDVVSEPETAKK